MKRGSYLFSVIKQIEGPSGYTPMSGNDVAAFFDKDGAEIRVGLNREGVVEVYYSTNVPNRSIVVRPTSSNTVEIRTAEL